MSKIQIAGCALLVALTLNISATNKDYIIYQPKQERPKPGALIAKLDLNKDGKISKEEAKGPLKKNFEKRDINKDGYITLEELNKAPKPQKKKNQLNN